MAFYIDSAIPGVAGKSLKTKTMTVAVYKAYDMLRAANVTDQLGIYSDPHGGQFYGYAIRENGECRFEEASAGNDAR